MAFGLQQAMQGQPEYEKPLVLPAAKAKKIKNPYKLGAGGLPSGKSPQDTLSKVMMHMAGLYANSQKGDALAKREKAMVGAEERFGDLKGTMVSGDNEAYAEFDDPDAVDYDKSTNPDREMSTRAKLNTALQGVDKRDRADTAARAQMQHPTEKGLSRSETRDNVEIQNARGQVKELLAEEVAKDETAAAALRERHDAMLKTNVGLSVEEKLESEQRLGKAIEDGQRTPQQRIKDIKSRIFDTSNDFAGFDREKQKELARSWKTARKRMHGDDEFWEDQWSRLGTGLKDKTEPRDVPLKDYEKSPTGTPTPGQHLETVLTALDEAAPTGEHELAFSNLRNPIGAPRRGDGERGEAPGDPGAVNAAVTPGPTTIGSGTTKDGKPDTPVTEKVTGASLDEVLRKPAQGMTAPGMNTGSPPIAAPRSDAVPSAPPVSTGVEQLPMLPPGTPQAPEAVSPQPPPAAPARPNPQLAQAMVPAAPAQPNVEDVTSIQGAMAQAPQRRPAPPVTAPAPAQAQAQALPPAKMEEMPPEKQTKLTEAVMSTEQMPDGPAKTARVKRIDKELGEGSYEKILAVIAQTMALQRGAGG